MAFSTESFPSRYVNPYLAEVEASNAVAPVTEQIKRLSVDDQLALLWYTYTEMGRTITPAAPGAARLHLAEGLLSQVRQMSYSEQLEFMRDLIRKTGTPATRAYGVLSANTKLAFWYQLAEWMKEGIVVPMPADYSSSAEVQRALDALKRLELSQQITVLRNIVVNMGVDPLAF
ncbi:orange carotenoid protein N-terminal domain-containing protein [Leptothermofonsia sp. ETS-13]|uniref:orange carotenoid protein N-terminal domain-containing protein n=1 Tax=Leptothermofonsia sp. ETS-13 TaxID=3035696 RepID=UPI003BA0BB78